MTGTLPPSGRREPNDPPIRVLYLHGLGSGPSAWTRAIEQAGPRVEARVAELPWHRFGVADWSHRGDPVAMLADAVTEAGPFDALVAHSFAAGLLLEAVATGRVSPVPSVLVSPFHRADPARFDWATLSYYSTGFHRIFAEALRLDRPDADPERLDAAARVLRDRIGPYGWMRFFEVFLRSPFVDLDAITAPQLVLVGDADIATRPADATALARALPRGRVEVLADCGHFPMIERSARFAAEVTAFLDSSPLNRQVHLESI